jgi:hypothetical protein
MTKATLIVTLGATLLAFGFGVGVGATLNSLTFLGPIRIVNVTRPLSDRERFLACTVSDDDGLIPEEIMSLHSTLRDMRAANA